MAASVAPAKSTPVLRSGKYLNHYNGIAMSKDRTQGHAHHDVVELRFLEKVSARLPEDLEVLQALAELYTKTGEYDKGWGIDLRLSQLLPNDDLVWYNLGCSHALTHHFDEAFEALSKAIDLGYGDYDWMKTDPDLANLNDDPRFESLLNWLYTVCNEEEI